VPLKSTANCPYICGAGLEIETSEIDAIYSKSLQLGGPNIAKPSENLGVPTSVQRQKLNSTLRRFCSNPKLLQAAERL
jgi:hypothetical protein